jgi:hypothetical protein
VSWAPDYATVAELKSYLHVADTDDDVFLALWITTASRNVDDWCGRQFGQVVGVESREYTATLDRQLGCYVAEIDDVQTVASMVVVDEDANEITDYTLGPVNALKKGKPYERIYSTCGGQLLISATWGWSAVPSAVKLGLFLQASRLAARRDSPYGIAGSPTDGNEVRLLAQLDPDFKTSLKPFRRSWWAA